MSSKLATSQKEEALQDIVSLAKHHSISLDDISHALANASTQASKPASHLPAY